MEKIVYLLVLSFGFLSVYNFLRDLEVDSRVVQLEHKSPQVGGRQRRDAKPEDDWQKIFNLDLKRFNNYIKTKSNETFQEEINRALMKFLSNLPSKQLCKLVKNCGKDCEEDEKIVFGEDKVLEKTRTKCVRGPPGPPGPPGPKGPKGPKGLGLEKPKLVKNTLDKGVVNLTDSKVFECKFFGSPIPEVSWKSPKSQFIINDTIDKENSTITSRLILTHISWSDQGPVECRAKSLLGEDIGAGNLTTLSKPVISMEKKLVFAPERINFTFPECKVRSYPTAKVTWKRIFWSMPAGRVKVRENKLTINNVQYSDEGFYVCEAENFLGVDKKTVQLKIKSFEMHQTSPSVIHSFSGDKVSINCSAYGNTQEMSGKITRSDSNVQSVEMKEGNLLFVSAEVTQGGAYVCSISNAKAKLESATLVKSFELSSSVLSTSHKRNIYNWLKEKNKQGTYQKCLSWTMATTSFYSSCGNKKDTLVIIQLYSGYYLGGFTDVAWNSYSSSKGNYKSFLFDLYYNRKYDIIDKHTNPICYYDGSGPCFANNQDLFINSGSYLYRRGNASPFNGLPNVSDGGYQVYYEVFYRE